MRGGGKNINYFDNIHPCNILLDSLDQIVKNLTIANSSNVQSFGPHKKNHVDQIIPSAFEFLEIVKSVKIQKIRHRKNRNLPEITIKKC